MPAPRVSSLLVEWDKAGRSKRVQILTEFIRAHRNSTAADIERDLGASAQLFFTRITAWLRLTYQLKHDLAVQLTAISLFLQGQRFLTNFMEVGGIQTLSDLLCQSGLRPADKQNALLILIHVSNSGRVFREMVCDGAGVDLLVQSMLLEFNERALELYGALFMALGQGNPRKCSLVHAGLVYAIHQGQDAAALTAATTLRSLQLSKQMYAVNKSVASTFPSITAAHANRKVQSAGGGRPKVDVTAALPHAGMEASFRRPPSAARDPMVERAGNVLLDAFFGLLRKENVKLRFEGSELLVVAANNSQLVSRVVNRALDVLEREVVVSDDEEDGTWNITPDQRQQAAAARVLSRIMHDDVGDGDRRPAMLREDVAHLLEKRAAHVTLLRLLLSAETKDLDTQREAAACLQRICREDRLMSMRLLAEEHLGPELLTSLLLARDFEVEDLRQFRLALERHEEATALPEDE